MNFGQLPYELQFESLLGLPYQEILRYCQTSTTAYQICQKEEFWNRKALQDFGIPNNVLSGPTPAQRYARLEQLSHDPQALILELVRVGYFPPLPDLFRSLNPVKAVRVPGAVRSDC